jgi:hypothetical protein
MLVVYWGGSPHLKQRGETGFCESFSIPHRTPGKRCGQVRLWWPYLAAVAQDMTAID